MQRNEIIIVTTKGCKGCVIQTNIVLQVIQNFSQNIDLFIKDYKSCDRAFLNEIKACDFPVTVFCKNNVVLKTLHGTKPVNTITEYCTELFG